jgi:hypothetical protein
MEAVNTDNAYGLEYRNKGFRGLKWFSKSFPLYENLNILDDYNNSNLKQGIEELLEKFGINK